MLFLVSLTTLYGHHNDYYTLILTFLPFVNIESGISNRIIFTHFCLLHTNVNFFYQSSEN